MAAAFLHAGAVGLILSHIGAGSSSIWQLSEIPAAWSSGPETCCAVYDTTGRRWATVRTHRETIS